MLKSCGPLGAAADEGRELGWLELTVEVRVRACSHLRVAVIAVVVWLFCAHVRAVYCVCVCVSVSRVVLVSIWDVRLSSYCCVIVSFCRVACMRAFVYMSSDGSFDFGADCVRTRSRAWSWSRCPRG